MYGFEKIVAFGDNGNDVEMLKKSQSVYENNSAKNYDEVDNSLVSKQDSSVVYKKISSFIYTF